MAKYVAPYSSNNFRNSVVGVSKNQTAFPFEQARIAPIKNRGEGVRTPLGPILIENRRTRLIIR